MTASIPTPERIDVLPDLTGSGRVKAGAGAALADQRIVGVLVAAIALAIALAAVPNWPAGVFQDDGIYVILGKSLASGQGYRYLNLPGGPYATHYPPGYPLFLALLWRISPQFPQNVGLFAFANAGFLALAAFATFRFTRERLALSTLGAAVVAVAGTVSMPALIFGVFVLSEPMFMALLVLLLIYAERAVDRVTWQRALVIGIAGGALAMVRTTAMFVVPAFVVVLLLRRRLVSAIVSAAACALFIVPWHFWVAAHGAEVPAVLLGKYGPYDTWLTNAIRAHGLPFVLGVIGKNIRALYGMIWVMFTGSEASPIVTHPPTVIAASALLALGAWRFGRRAPVTAWFIAAYLALVVVWPFEPTRFVWALLPLFAAMIALGVRAVMDWTPARPATRYARCVALVASALLGVGFGWYNVNGVRQGWRDSVPRGTAARATPVVEWVRSRTRPTDVIATEDDALVYLYTGRRAVPVGTFTPEEYLTEQTYSFAAGALHEIVSHYAPTYVIGTTSYGVMAAKKLSARTPPEVRVHTLLPTVAIFAPVPR